MSRTGDELRRHKRVKLSFYADWGSTPDCARHARITSISAGGCFIQTTDEARAGQAVFIRLTLAGEYVLGGEVRYHMPGVGFGVMFVNVPIEERLALEALVEQYRRPG